MLLSIYNWDTQNIRAQFVLVFIFWKKKMWAIFFNFFLRALQSAQHGRKRSESQIERIKSDCGMCECNLFFTNHNSRIHKTLYRLCVYVCGYERVCCYVSLALRIWFVPFFAHLVLVHMIGSIVFKSYSQTKPVFFAHFHFQTYMLRRRVYT